MTLALPVIIYWVVALAWAKTRRREERIYTLLVAAIIFAVIAFATQSQWREFV